MDQRTTRHTRLTRTGFTLIEIAVVILILGTLVVLLLPAIQSARNSARVGAVSSELNQLSAAITQFRNTFGAEPPSSITIYTTAAGWQSDPVSMGKVRRLWPNFDFSMSTGPVPATWGQANVLTGAECLVFFLGGVNGAGFSKNPAAPFTPAGSDYRDGPYFDFKASRFCDIDADGFSEYRDSWPDQSLPIVYASSNDGQGYVATDLIVSNNSGTVSAGDMSLQYQAPGATVAARRSINPQSFQLVSPGADHAYGAGGVWTEGSTFSTTIAADVQPTGVYASQAAAQAARFNELDNITNFSTGTLGGR